MDLIHHVLDCMYLHMNILGKIKQMDAWNTKNWAAAQEYEAAKSMAKIEKGARDELRYNISQHKREWREFAALVARGVNPAHILKGITG